MIGARITSGVCSTVAGLAYLGVGNAVNLAMYTVCMCIVVGGVMSAGLHLRRGSGHPVVPQEKGIVMGYTTMGLQSGLRRLCPLITLLVGRLGIGNGVIPISVAPSCLAFLVCFSSAIPAGAASTRTMGPMRSTEPSTSTAMEDPTGGWTTGSSVAVQRKPQLVAVTTGIFQICSPRREYSNGCWLGTGLLPGAGHLYPSAWYLIGLVGPFFRGLWMSALAPKKVHAVLGI